MGEDFLLQQMKEKVDAISELRCLEDTWQFVVEEIETRSNKHSCFANATLTCFALLKTITAVTCLYVKLHQASYTFNQTIDGGRTVHMSGINAGWKTGRRNVEACRDNFFWHDRRVG